MQHKPTQIPGLAVAILAGGASRRMGADKAWLDFGGEPLLGRICRAVAAAADVLVVARGTADRELPPLPAAAILVADDAPGAGPLAGLAAAAAVLPPRVSTVFVASCDLPFVGASVVRKLAEAIGGDRGLVPVVGGRPQVVAALYARPTVAEAARRFAAGERRARCLGSLPGVRRLDEAGLRRIGIDPAAFDNLNGPGDYARALGRLRRG